MRTTARDINYTGPGSRLCVLRPELVAMFCQVSACWGHVNIADACLSIWYLSKVALLDAFCDVQCTVLYGDFGWPASYCISWLQVEAQERVKNSKSDDDQTDEKSLVQEELSKIVLNPNVFTDFKVAGSQEVRISRNFMNVYSSFFCFGFGFGFQTWSELGCPLKWVWGLEGVRQWNLFLLMYIFLGLSQ